MRILTTLVCALAFCGRPCLAGEPGRPELAARELSLRVSSAPAGTAALFDGRFFQHVSLAYIEEVLRSFHQQAGAVESVRLERLDGELAGRFVYVTAGGYDIPVTLGLDPKSGKISTLYFKPPYKRDATLASVESGLAALPGRAGLLVLRLGKKTQEPLRMAGLNEKEYFAVGSLFKLYVLGAVREEQVPWSRVYRLGEKDMSLPSGRLQDWPDGSPLTVHTLSALMISESDNTAADLLISSVGRRRVEAHLSGLGHSDPARLRPFLRTSELFRLRSDTEVMVKYLNLPEEEKYVFLDGLNAPLVQDKVQRSPFGVARPEWPASPADICALLDHFRLGGDSEVLQLLGINKGLEIPSAFTYAGFKGGSLAGVRSAAWLLRRGDDDWYCLAAAVNNDKDEVNEKEFFGLMQSALQALAAVK